ncbi:helix-turn-helix domain-containing protein [Liquorilactobacillus hordei]|uniref:helix-turn-helix domain-containing protein n=1 Tax=Liquorilactobacillus hordei TaxID=468911 RepID=UPI001CBE299E|nr:helix-turn-helix transcriptional regulator [Liquorilactobacillus hordei]MBZ2406124.1 hypothetical protein [Liquorilactobacillus hordei]
MKNRLRKLRQRKGLTLEEETKLLAETVSLRLSPDALAKYERGDREPKLETWESLANFFNFPVGYVQGIRELGNWETIQNMLEETRFCDDVKKDVYLRNHFIDLFSTLVDKNEELERRIEDLEDPEKFDRDTGDL